MMSHVRCGVICWARAHAASGLRAVGGVERCARAPQRHVRALQTPFPGVRTRLRKTRTQAGRWPAIGPACVKGGRPGRSAGIGPRDRGEQRAHALGAPRVHVPQRQRHHHRDRHPDARSHPGDAADEVLLELIAVVEPAVVLADAGYCNEPDLLELENRGIDAHVALGREGKSRVAVDPARLPATHRMGEKLASLAGKAQYAQRKWLSEAPNGWIKEVLGFRRFSLRGLAKVRGEWNLVCLALNIKRMGTLAAC